MAVEGDGRDSRRQPQLVFEGNQDYSAFDNKFKNSLGIDAESIQNIGDREDIGRISEDVSKTQTEAPD
jgi:hypothetical protein